MAQIGEEAWGLGAGAGLLAFLPEATALLHPFEHPLWWGETFAFLVLIVYFLPKLSWEL